MPKSQIYLMDSKKFIARYAKNLVLEDMEKAILCFSSATAKKLQTLYKGKRFHCLGSCWDIYTKNKTLVISQFGVGAPSALLQFEYLKTFKIPLVFSLGSIASFDQSLKPAEWLLINQAYNEKIFSSNLKNLNSNKKDWERQIIKNPYRKESDQLIKDLSLRSITSVSCDTPYKITREHYRFYISHKISGLEMEASALLSESKKSKIPLFCLALVSDFLDDKNWEMNFSSKEFQNSLFSLLKKLLFYKFKIPNQFV